MNPRVLNGLLPVLFFLGILSVAAAQDKGGDPRKELPNVIIVTLSGVRNSEVFDDAQQRYFPHLQRDLLKEGVLYNNLVDQNFEFHLPQVSAINTGQNYPVYLSKVLTPSIFQFLISQKGVSPERAWLVGAWSLNLGGVVTKEYPPGTLPCFLTTRYESCPQLRKLMTDDEWQDMQHCQKTLETRWGHWDSYSIDQYSILKRILMVFRPKLVHLVVGDPETAHYGSFARYVRSLRSTDERIFELFEIIQKDPFYKDNTYLFVTTDHERNRYYMQHGQKQYDAPEPVWLYVFGPDIKQDTVISREVHHIDIFPTVAKIFGLTHPPTEGKVLDDCFEK